jgi:SAM-dependent methyltransferase
MASNPKKLLQKIFATNRRILVNQSISSIEINKSWRKILVVGAGNDPYRDLFDDLDLYVRLDIVVKKGIVDVVADAHNLPFQADSFDCIMAIEVFEHLENPDLFINEAYRVLKSSKSIFLSIPFMFHEHGDPYDFVRPTKFLLEKYCKNFSKLEILSQGSRIHIILDFISTSKSFFGLLRFLRIFNHFVCLFKSKSHTSAPSGYFIKATK